MKTNRTQLTNGTQEKHWPAGNYCIYKAGDNCPRCKYLELHYVIVVEIIWLDSPETSTNVDGNT